MYTYMVVCTVILHFIVLLFLITEIKTIRENKKYVAEKVKAEKAWQQWAKNLRELEQNLTKEMALFQRQDLEKRIVQHKRKKYYFSSIKTEVPFLSLGETNKWFLKEESHKQTG